jgi:hypothetical protein
MPMFTREESLLVWIHEKREVEERHASTLSTLISSGWVTGIRDSEDKYTEITLTPRGKAKVGEVIMRD